MQQHYATTHQDSATPLHSVGAKINTAQQDSANLSQNSANSASTRRIVLSKSQPTRCKRSETQQLLTNTNLLMHRNIRNVKITADTVCLQLFWERDPAKSIMQAHRIPN